MKIDEKYLPTLIERLVIQKMENENKLVYREIDKLTRSH